MNPYKSDFHLHTAHIGCANETMTVKAILDRCAALGLERIAFTDHMDNAEREAKHQLIRDDLAGMTAPLDIYWGAEFNFLECDGGFYADAARVEELELQLVIGGIHSNYMEAGHYDLQKMVDIQHRHHLKVCELDMFDVLVHPYWFAKHSDFDKKGFPWFDSMKAVPDSYARELGQAAKETHTAIEVNGSAIFKYVYSDAFVEEYKRYIGIMAEEGCQFSLGSDAHDISQLDNILVIQEAMQELGIPAEQLFTMSVEPFKPKGQ